MRLILAALLLVPSPGFAQTVRVVVETPVLSAPAFTPGVSAALSSPISLSPAAASLTGSLSVLPAPVIAVAAPTAAVPAALIPATAVFAIPAAADVPAESAKAESDVRFDASASQAATVPEPVAAPSVPGLENSLAKLGPVRAPNQWVEKGKVTLAYAGLTASAVAFHYPFDRIAPLVLAVVMAVPMTFMWMMFYTYGQSSAKGGETKIVGDVQPKPETLERVARLAKEAKLPPPARLRVVEGEKVQAAAGNHDETGYEIRLSQGLEALRPEVQDAILRHEFAHIRHHDAHWTVATMFMAPLPIMIGLFGMIDKPDAFGWLVGAIAATSVLLFPASLQHSEYMADQYAASKPDGAAPMARFFVEDSENPVRAASALSGVPFATETGWKRRAVAAWDRMKTMFKAHPSHDRRTARLARLAKKNAP